MNLVDFGVSVLGSIFANQFEKILPFFKLDRNPVEDESLSAEFQVRLEGKVLPMFRCLERLDCITRSCKGT